MVIVIDQFRADYLERYHDQFGDGGFRVFLDRGAYFTDCNYDYANTRTAPGHSTLFTGSYTSGHGILSNEWWDPQKKKLVTSVEDDTTKPVGIASTAPGASPHNLLSDTVVLTSPTDTGSGGYTLLRDTALDGTLDDDSPIAIVFSKPMGSGQSR